MEVSNVKVLHQQSELSFLYHNNTWGYEGNTCLYVTSNGIIKDDKLSLALNFRGGCVIESVEVSRIEEVKNKGIIKVLAFDKKDVTYDHVDPLEKILCRNIQDFVRNNTTKEVENINKLSKEADSQYHRGGYGMMLSLRAASLASSLGEIRVSVINNDSKSEERNMRENEIIDCWMEELLEFEALNVCCNSELNNVRKKERLKLVAEELCSYERAMKLKIKYYLPSYNRSTTGGLHFVYNEPIVYTTNGLFGDPYSSPRTWIPCCDSALMKHRCSHEIIIKVTADSKLGLTIVGCGEDYGMSMTKFHRTPKLHFMKDIVDISSSNSEILYATHIWKSLIYSPIPARSLGFAIGPFLSLPDPEYHEGMNSNDFRSNSGIRQIFVAPKSIRSEIHFEKRCIVLPSLESAIIGSTSGVPFRALCIMREILGMSHFGSECYTQIWIPNVVDGGCSSGGLDSGTYLNSFLGGAIIDSKLLFPPKYRLPYYNDGRTLQFQQAKCAIWGWLISMLPLGNINLSINSTISTSSSIPEEISDDVGEGYLHSLFFQEIFSIYERTSGATGEGGSKYSFFYNGNIVGSGLNSSIFDSLPVKNVEEEIDDDIGASGGAWSIPIDGKNNDELWRSIKNGTESRTSSSEEYSVRKFLTNDVLDVLERGVGGDKTPLPSMGWMGSHLSLSFLTSNSCNSTYVGCGALELLHPVGGSLYRNIKCNLLARLIEARSGMANIVRLIRCCFIATMIADQGKTKSDSFLDKLSSSHRPPFVICLDEILKHGGIKHSLFVRALRLLSGPIREPFLGRGTLVDPAKESHDYTPEGFPNTYIRGASMLFMRVGIHVESASEDKSSQVNQNVSTVKGIHLHVYVEPVIPEGGSAFGGPVTLRVVENEGQVREFTKHLNVDGSRCEWGPIFLHAKNVTTAKQQTAASGTLETGSSNSAPGSVAAGARMIEKGVGSVLGTSLGDALLNGGYQALELVRLTNRTPLLWIRIDPNYQYVGKFSIFQPDYCLGEQLFHDGDAIAQLESQRALAERPLRIQGSVRINTVYDVNVKEMPARLLGDCLRGSPALHCSLPHSPAIRTQAALALAQWQNNKAPASHNAVGVDSWLGLHLLLLYFNERFIRNEKDGLAFIPVKYTRITVKRNTEVEPMLTNTAATADEEDEDARRTGTTASATATAGSNSEYIYLDSFDDEERATVLENAEDIQIEEDEEYRVRSSVVTAIACIRAKNAQTPPLVLRFMEALLQAGLTASMSSVEDDLFLLPANKRRKKPLYGEDTGPNNNCGVADLESITLNLPYISSSLLADALLALCHINCRPSEDAAVSETQTCQPHPILPLMELCQRLLEWELYKELTRLETSLESSGVGGECFSVVPSCAITALCSMAILKQSTSQDTNINEARNAQFYIDIFDSNPTRSDVVRAAAAQAVACICCASDRGEHSSEALGLLHAFEFLLNRILENKSSSGLRNTLAALMLDASTGKVCSYQRVGTIGGRNDICRFLNGPLGASHGGDNGSALLMSVSETSYPAANAVNNGARRGLRLLSRAGRDDTYSAATVVKVAKFATKLWRTINGEDVSSETFRESNHAGICAYDGRLRVSLLALWQWIWPKTCIAVLRVQSWDKLGGKKESFKGDADLSDVMKCSEEERKSAEDEEAELINLKTVVNAEIDRQKYRGELAQKNFEYWKSNGKKNLTGANAHGLGQPLPVVQKDNAWKLGGWAASAAQQRRAMSLDGGSKVQKVRLTVKSTNTDD